MNKFFTSDSHYGHKNICKGVSVKPDTAIRIFDTLEEMNEVLVDRINEVVKENDELYHLGDFSLGSKENVVEFRRRIKCKNVHLIKGNHDKHIDKNKNLQSLFTTYSPYKEIKYGEIKIVLSHFAHRVWNKSHHGSWHLYGHSHGSLQSCMPLSLVRKMLESGSKIDEMLKEIARLEETHEYGLSMDVGADTNDFYPYSIEEIESVFKNRNKHETDHHR